MTDFPKPSARRAVTLIETIMVIMLLAAAATSGLMIFDGQWVARRGAKQATADVAGALVTARSTSIHAAAPVRVTRGTKNGHQLLTISEQPGPFRAGKSWTIDLGAETRISGSPNTIQFNADGTADHRLEWKVAQQNTAGVVSVAPVQGLISRKLP